MMRIGYLTIGTNDLPRAAAVYHALLGDMGAKRMIESEKFVAWSVSADKPGLGVGYFRDLDGKKRNFFHMS